MDRISLTQLATRILLDVPPPRPTDAAYLFAQTDVNTDSVINRGVGLIESGQTGRLLISGLHAASGYPGAEDYRSRLLKAGVPGEKISAVEPPEGPIMHTTNESRALVSFSLRQNLKSLHIAASPLHQLRAFISAVSAALRAAAPLLLFSAPGEAQPWDTVVFHSQGTTQGARGDLLVGELARIEKYRACGDLASNEEIWSYLRTRDG